MSSSSYTQPEQVTSPKAHWNLIKVLHKGPPESASSADYSIALGTWDGDPCLGIRWNANEDRPVGNPHSRGLPTWFILPKPVEQAVLSTLDDKAQALARSLLETA